MKLQSVVSALALTLLPLTSTGALAANKLVVSPVLSSPKAMISSAGDLNKYLQSATRSASPLGALSPNGRGRFLASLSFNQRGLTGFRYDDLQAELTPTQIYQIFKSVWGAA